MEPVTTGDPSPAGRASLPEPLRPMVMVVALAALMWTLEIVDIPLDGRLDRYGIKPRRLDGLPGIVAAPFLHDGFGHLIANTIPFVVLGAVIAFSGVRRFALVTLIIGAVAGVGTWLTGTGGTVTIGASGLVFGYLTYLVARGIFARNVGYLVGGLIVLALYGGVLWGLLPRPGVSWQGHLFGAIGGVVAARVLHPPRRRADRASPAPL
jgi:membrane associated rhomboid family serine protease